MCFSNFQIILCLIISHVISLIIGHHHLKNIVRHKVAKHEPEKKVEEKTEDKPESEKPGKRYLCCRLKGISGRNDSKLV